MQQQLAGRFIWGVPVKVEGINRWLSSAGLLMAQSVSVGDEANGVY